MTRDLSIVNRRCAGMDVHKDFVTVSARIVAKRKVEYLDARFDTTTRGLLALAAFLEQHGVDHALMEATGVYWKPVWHILEGRFQLTLANAHDVRNLPGRKSDVNDARWLCTLATYGLVRASFVPPRPVWELRDLTRTRHQLMRQVVQNQNRVARILEAANIKLGSVVSDLFGVSGRRILEAMVAGETDPVRLAALADRRLKAKPSELAAALAGRFSRHHAFLVREHLALIDQLHVRIANVETRVGGLLAPLRQLITDISLIPGVKARAAAAIIAEIGFDMSRFPTDGHMLSWARLVPRLDETGGRIRSRRVKQGGAWLKPLLIQCAAPSVSGGGGTHEEHLSFGSVRFDRRAARRQTGGHGRCRLDPHGHLPHAQERHARPAACAGTTRHPDQAKTNATALHSPDPSRRHSDDRGNRMKTHNPIRSPRPSLDLRERSF